jgi:hypothetical protein
MTELNPKNFDEVLDKIHRSVEAVVQGDPEPQKELWSRADEVPWRIRSADSTAVGRMSNERLTLPPVRWKVERVRIREFRRSWDLTSRMSLRLNNGKPSVRGGRRHQR